MVEKTKYLGINIDESLNWREQYNYKFQKQAQMGIKFLEKVDKYPFIKKTNMKSEVLTSRVLKTGMIFLTTFENKNQSLVSKKVFESIS